MMSEQRHESGSGFGRGQNRCTGRVGRGVQIPGGSPRGRGFVRPPSDRNGGREQRDSRNDRDGRAQDDDFRRNWPKFGVEPEQRASFEREIDSLSGQVSAIDIDSTIKFAAKLSPGTNGRNISLLTNYFTFKVSDKLTVHQYEVVIRSLDCAGGDSLSSVKIGAKYRRLIVEQLMKSNRCFDENVAIYDCHGTLFSRSKFNFENESGWDASNSLVEFEVRAREFQDEPPTAFLVKLSYIGSLEVDLNSNCYSKNVMNFIDLLLRYGHAAKNKAIGNSVFASQRRLSLSMEKELAIGFSQNVYNCECGLLLNVDRTVCVFYTSRPVINFFRDRIQGFEKAKSLPEDKVQECADELQGLYVKVTLGNCSKRVRVCGVTTQTASELSCKYEKKADDGTVTSSDTVSVVEYFESDIHKLRFPHFPCLVSGNEYYPLEVCELIGDQKVKSDDDATSEKSIKLSEVKPCKRFNEISNAISSIRTDGEYYTKEFGVSICPSNVQIKGRVLDAPSLKVANDATIVPDDHRCWNVNRPNSVFEGVHIKDWIVVYISKDRWKMLDDEFNAQFAQKVIEVAGIVGIRMEQPLKIFTHDYVDVDKLKKDVFEQFENLKFIVFLTQRKDNLYNLMKKLAVYEYGIPSQCVSADNYSSSPRDNKLLHFFYLRNVVLQINAKLNGINWILDAPWTSSMKRVMFIGIDVKQVSRNSSYPLSIVSCVGTVDDKLVRYENVVSVQDASRHKIVDVKAAITKLLQSYKLNNEVFPDAIIVYRKGVFEDTFPEFLVSEVSLVKDLLSKIGCNAKISYVCIQKRADFRMLPVNHEEATNQLTVPAGVVVDTVITNPALHSFFLCSNIDYKGTGSPPYYTLLFDENDLTADKLQQITHDMCFLHPFGARAAVLPIPVELAKSRLDRASERIVEMMRHGLSCSSEDREEQFRKLNETLVVHKNIDRFLYYI